jgi:recombinational DNA repair ATPase RecF
MKKLLIACLALTLCAWAAHTMRERDALLEKQVSALRVQLLRSHADNDALRQQLADVADSVDELRTSVDDLSTAVGDFGHQPTPDTAYAVMNAASDVDERTANVESSLADVPDNTQYIALRLAKHRHDLLRHPG